MSVAGIADVAASGPNAFAAKAVGQWLGIPPGNLVIVPVSPPKLSRASDVTEGEGPTGRPLQLCSVVLHYEPFVGQWTR